MVSEARLRRWLRDVRQGRRPIEDVVRRLKRFPIEQLSFARLDTHRRLRRGLPEVVLCEGKTASQIIALVKRMMAAQELILLTRLDQAVAQALRGRVPAVRYDATARLGSWLPKGHRPGPKGLVLVASGGTADLPIAEEAAGTLQILGSRAVRLYDVGVAGIHRVLSAFALIQRARAIVVVAGMEGALASVVAGLARCPVIAVPTSIGYGAGFSGIGPLLTMLNSCVPGVAVVNIDNGFGAGYLAHVINTTKH
ncbi:MAG TPA: nickel pincer cofactor biosynthesis protein LarB [Candidatus Omnitrophica bacterium]|nr:MAG: 1-(5-phosphoribosyl)-5-amino-4-imidazole-carboxylate carboxylase [Omnitrophica WOR_2 bacterium GWA2_63_20]OGX18473.1 MAG: 1-(5-phosphoribosyl)-5-amino-4-imidazole-carboxylate carboxylase [Omnitrophica WOR_2 bacterium GWF2_63_9]OGX35561.1 MAG: 1-(5-phosphoribosyl)-5-amino-4-imidazole-carboxylate carboxylase [Omnitrophica WOR_2 bacterium RIFCSPHIGHO2_02_FULL_63_39]OGX46468.1 MAG: 1-(5-phosphoribosyl)-5-amino-4-imidazole-carboxylate carboxylase [Omnitrophica WOR_2 bacterium RIFCSPLOWO2_02_F